MPIILCVVDIDECTAEGDEPPCKENEFCTNTEGSHTCTGNGNVFVSPRTRKILIFL